MGSIPARIQERKLLETDLDWLKTIPTQKLIQRNAIEPQKDKVLLLRTRKEISHWNSPSDLGWIWSI